MWTADLSRFPHLEACKIFRTETAACFDGGQTNMNGKWKMQRVVGAWWWVGALDDAEAVGWLLGSLVLGRTVPDSLLVQVVSYSWFLVGCCAFLLSEFFNSISWKY